MTIVQPYVPDYRVPFFDELARQLAEEGYRLVVAHGGPTGQQASRGDARLGTWSLPIRARNLSLGTHTLSYRPVLALARNSSLLIAELASTNLDTYLLALTPGVRLLLWGHGKAYVTEPSALDSALELFLAKRAEHVFVYTDGGADALRSRGYDPASLTVIRNSTDTVALRSRAAALTEADVAAFRAAHDLGTGPVAAFVGSFDESKSLPLLVDAAARVHDQCAGFRLLIAGAGPLQDRVESAARDHAFIRLLPRADQDCLARIGHVADLLLMPGRVGLVAVDALALGLPVVTTDFSLHAPEAEYLTPDVSLVTSERPEELAQAVLSLVSDPSRLVRMSAAARELGASFGVEPMSRAFVNGLFYRDGNRATAVPTPRILWITNVSAPYRRPVWAEIASSATLGIGLLAENEPNRRWTSQLPAEVGRHKLRAVALHPGGEHRGYLLLHPALRGPKPDAVILPGWEHPAAWQILVEAKLRRIACVGFYESSQMSHHFRRGPVAGLRRWFFRHVDAVLTVGEASKEEVLRFGVDPARVVSTYNAVDVAAFHGEVNRTSDDLRSSGTFLHVGQLIPRKNVDGLLRAFAAMGEETELIIAGQGPEKRRLRRLSKTLGVDQRVRFVGYVEPESLPTVFARAATLVLASHVEVYGLVVNEALASGLQVVVSDRAGVSRDVQGMPGVYVAAPTTSGLAGAMRTSQSAWRGPVVHSAVLARTPEAMAADVIRATKLAASTRSRHRRNSGHT